MSDFLNALCCDSSPHERVRARPGAAWEEGYQSHGTLADVLRRAGVLTQSWELSPPAPLTAPVSDDILSR